MRRRKEALGGVKWADDRGGLPLCEDAPDFAGALTVGHRGHDREFLQDAVPVLLTRALRDGRAGHGDADVCKGARRRLREYGGVYHGALAAQGDDCVGGDIDLCAFVVRLGVQPR